MEDKKRGVPLRELTGYRSVWMGCAIVAVMLYHAAFDLGPLYYKLNTFLYGGVDIFFFASGLGMYASYVRDHDPLRFMRRRLARLLPVYLPFILGWCAYRMAAGQQTWYTALGNIFMIQVYSTSGVSFNWYITGILTAYLLTPYLAALVERTKNRLQALALIAALFAASLAFWNTADGIIIASRFPVFVTGMYVARLASNRERRATPRAALGLLAAGVAGLLLLRYFYAYQPDYLWFHGLYWYPFLLVAPALCFLISAFFRFTRRLPPSRWLAAGLAKVGECSFELYLSHILCFDLYRTYLTPLGTFRDGNGARLLVIAASAALAVLLHLVSLAVRALCVRLRRTKA